MKAQKEDSVIKTNRFHRLQSRGLIGLALLAAMGLLTTTARSETVTWDGTNNMTWAGPSDSTSWSGGTYDDGDDAQFLGAGTGMVMIAGTVNPSNITVDAGDYSFDGGILNSAGALTKLGTHTLTLNNTAMSVGGNLELARGPMVLAGTSTTTVAGVMNVANNGISGGGAADLTVQDGAVLTANGQFTIGNRHNQVGTVTQTGGTVDLNGAALFGVWAGAQGHYTISNGTLNVLNNRLTLGNDGKGYLYVNGGTVNLKGAELAWKANANREGHIFLNGGTLNIGSFGIRRDRNAYSVTLTSGTLGSLDAWASNANLDITLAGDADGGSLDIDTTGGDISLYGDLSGPGGFTKVGTNTLTLVGANTYTGTTVVASGVLHLATGASLDAESSVRITESGAMDVDGATTVEMLWFDDRPQRIGTWGAPASGADYEDARFTGSSAFLTVTSSGAPPGFVCIIK